MLVKEVSIISILRQLFSISFSFFLSFLNTIADYGWNVFIQPNAIVTVMEFVKPLTCSINHTTQSFKQTAMNCGMVIRLHRAYVITVRLLYFLVFVLLLNAAN